MKRITLVAIAWIVVMVFGPVQVHADDLTVAPFTFSAVGLGSFTPGGGPAARARWEKVGGDWQLHLEKNVPTTEFAAAGAQLSPVIGLSTTGLTLGFTVESGWCGAGAPRFNVRLTNGDLIFLGCFYGNDGSGNVSFTGGGNYGGQVLPLGEIVESISIIFDEGNDVGPGFVYLDDIFVSTETAGAPGRQP
ncbi:MAG TPA: hypothetical protein VNN77_10235 [candidate division Zixibacteria bacterium]|nr:hypothetical protein [candidate division Zixibacteria bacterium]